MSRPLLSILMANYNNGRFIGEAIESVLAQTYGNWELVIVDDCSNDESVSVVSGYLKDSRIKLLANNERMGCGATKNKCAANAIGEIFGELDPDDVLAENSIEEIVSFYESHPDLGFVCTTHYECNELLRIKRINPWAVPYDSGLTNLLMPMSTAMRTFRRNVYFKTAGYDAFFERAVDKDIVYKLEEVAKTGFLDRPLYYYRMHSKGISTGVNAWKARIWNSRARYNAYLRRRETAIPNLSQAEAGEILIDAFWRSLCVGEFIQARFLIYEIRKFPGAYPKLILYPAKVIARKLKEKIWNQQSRS